MIGAYCGTMENRSLWEMMFQDANISANRGIKQKALDLQKFHLLTVSMVRQLVELDKNRELIAKIPLSPKVNKEYLKFKSLGSKAANKALRLLILLRKINNRPIYTHKIWCLKFIIDKNDE